ncbi:uncharacterized protein [Panulirus ornatus]|uniref:uncharacterized protein n=1 Tax=Panulirus ornatus TaxID=150431 RepID=UPI003A858607
MVPDAMADAALVPDGSSRAPVPNNTEYLPERYHNLLQMGSRGVFRRLGTEPRSGNTATAARQGGNARITEAMKTSGTSPEDGPKTSINSSRDPHNSGDLGIPRETHQGILSSTGSLPGKNNSETSHSIPPNISHGPDYSYLPPGFGGIDNGEGCSCWQTHDDSFMKEIECRCQGEHVVQLPTNLSTNVDRLTLTKTGVESLGNGNLSQYTAALQELILRDAKKLKKMETDCFRGMGRLRTIYISHAPRLTTLPPHIFHAYLPSLKVLRIVYTGLTELPNLTQLITKTIIHMVDLENNKIQRIRGGSIKIRTEQLLLDNNMLETVEARAFHGSQIGKLDLSETGISHLPTVGLEGLETLRLVRTYNLKVFPSVYSFKSITTAELTYHYHCCAFKFPKLHDPAEHKKHEIFNNESTEILGSRLEKQDLLAAKKRLSTNIKIMKDKKIDFSHAMNSAMQMTGKFSTDSCLQARRKSRLGSQMDLSVVVWERAALPWDNTQCSQHTQVFYAYGAIATLPYETFIPESEKPIKWNSRTTHGRLSRPSNGGRDRYI